MVKSGEEPTAASSMEADICSLPRVSLLGQFVDSENRAWVIAAFFGRKFSRVRFSLVDPRLIYRPRGVKDE